MLRRLRQRNSEDAATIRYLGLYQLGYTIATFGWSSSTRWPTSYVAAALTLPSPWTDRERDRKRTPRRNQREGIKKFADSLARLLILNRALRALCARRRLLGSLRLGFASVRSA